MPSIIVVGAGIMGLCSAWALSRRGHDVTVIEQGSIPNPAGSSYDEHRIIRHAYGAMHGYARLMPDAFAAWRLLWTDLGTGYGDRHRRRRARDRALGRPDLVGRLVVDRGPPV